MFFLKELPTREILDRYSNRYSDMNIEKTEAALKMLRKASILLRELEAYFSQNGLSQTRFLILIVLDREPELDPLTISDLVDRLDVSKPVITNTLKTLEDEALVEVFECIKDRRAKRISITVKGQQKLHAILPGYYRLINEAMAG